jgi:hypothetical protein
VGQARYWVITTGMQLHIHIYPTSFSRDFQAVDECVAECFLKKSCCCVYILIYVQPILNVYISVTQAYDCHGVVATTASLSYS